MKRHYWSAIGFLFSSIGIFLFGWGFYASFNGLRTAQPPTAEIFYPMFYYSSAGVFLFLLGIIFVFIGIFKTKRN